MKKIMFTGRKTVADVMSVFTKAIADLDAVQEAQKASATRAKLEALLNG